MVHKLILIFCLLGDLSLFAQQPIDSIYSNFVLNERRNSFHQNLNNKIITQNLKAPLDSITESNYRESCWAISQFLLRSHTIETGFKKMFQQYQSLDFTTKRAFLEAIYASYPTEYKNEISELLLQESSPKLFAMQSLYLYRIDPKINNIQFLTHQIQTQFSAFKNDQMLITLQEYILNHSKNVLQKTPSINVLFAHQKKLNQKIIYSFQRWNRNYPGIAAIQNVDGHFLRDQKGQILLVEQLARAGSNLPYFITNGNSPQGIYRITGTAISQNLFIGPTQNLQLLMPFEADAAYWDSKYDSSKDAQTNYLNLLPKEWQGWAPIKEAFQAGQIGRTEIIAHGTTIDPNYFKGLPFYPLTPTLGCLCAKEIWNSSTGKLLESDQFSLAGGFLSTPGNTGYLMVINIDNQTMAVSKKEIVAILEAFEKKIDQ